MTRFGRSPQPETGALMGVHGLVLKEQGHSDLHAVFVGFPVQTSTFVPCGTLPKSPNGKGSGRRKWHTPPRTWRNTPHGMMRASHTYVCPETSLSRHVLRSAYDHRSVQGSIKLEYGFGEISGPPNQSLDPMCRDLLTISSAGAYVRDQHMLYADSKVDTYIRVAGQSGSIAA